MRTIAFRPRRLRLLAILTFLVIPSVLLGGKPVAAAPGDLIADVTTPEAVANPDNGKAKAVAFDGHNLYYGEFGGSVIHRIDMPPAGASSATGHTDIPITGAPTGIMTYAYDVGRDKFWAVDTYGTTIYLIDKLGVAVPQFKVVAASLPGFCKVMPCSTEVKIAYDRTDDTIWYSPDTTRRVYHFQTTPDLLGNAVLVAATPYVDVDVAPNQMLECPNSSYVSGLAVGGTSLFFETSTCLYYFEWGKDGTKLGATPRSFATSGGLSCDNLTYPVSVIWFRDGWNGHIYALEQPRANACVYGGG